MTSNTQREHGFREPPNPGSGPFHLLFALFGGTIPWTVHPIASYSVANYACGSSIAPWLLHGLTVATAAIVVAAFLTALRLTRATAARPPEERAPEEQRDQFLASGGLLLAGLGFLAILFGESSVIIAGCGT